MSVIITSRTRWFLSLVSLRLARLHVTYDLCSAIETADGMNVQIPVTWLPTDALKQTVCLFRRRRECKARRPPRTLADAERAFILENAQRRRDIGAGEAASTLNRSKIVAEEHLHFFDRRTEVRNVAFRERGQSLHQDESAQVRRSRLRKRRKLAEYIALVRPMHPLSVRIKQNQNAPALRERHSADDRRWLRQLPASAINDKAAMIEQPDSDTRARTAPKSNGIAAHIERQSKELPQAGRHGKCDLSARTEAGMRRDDFVNPEVATALEIESVLHRLQVAARTLSFGAAHPKMRGRADRDACPEAADRQADAPEATA